ncbi:hypothetical protein B0H19DRAFT_1080468 [Mycena capillaripes]|nr:hypothetical protein B0H19DRAFT_1080468 [Mycena capillaripes]
MFNKTPRSGGSSFHVQPPGPSTHNTTTYNGTAVALSAAPQAQGKQVDTFFLATLRRLTFSQPAASLIGRNIFADAVPSSPPQPQPSSAAAPVRTLSPPKPKWANPGQQEDWMTPLPLPRHHTRPIMPMGPLDPCQPGMDTDATPLVDMGWRCAQSVMTGSRFPGSKGDGT